MRRITRRATASETGAGRKLARPFKDEIAERHRRDTFGIPLPQKTGTRGVWRLLPRANAQCRSKPGRDQRQFGNGKSSPQLGRTAASKRRHPFHCTRADKWCRSVYFQNVECHCRFDSSGLATQGFYFSLLSRLVFEFAADEGTAAVHASRFQHSIHSN